MDVCGPFSTGEYVVRLTDCYSRRSEATIFRTVTSTNILELLDNVFVTHGYPKHIKTYNATHFTSHEFKQTLTSWGIQLHFVTPYLPRHEKKETDNRAKEHAKEYADRKCRTEDKYFKVGERVLVH